MCLCEVCYISSVGSCMYELVVCFMNKMLSSSFNIKNCRSTNLVCKNVEEARCKQLQCSLERSKP